ncbi:TPA: hypothetical protein ACGRWC_003592, partial [Escherichia coli]
MKNSFSFNVLCFVFVFDLSIWSQFGTQKETRRKPRFARRCSSHITFILGLGELSLAGTASGVIGLNGYVTIPLIISGSRRTLIIQWGQARFG